MSKKSDDEALRKRMEKSSKQGDSYSSGKRESVLDLKVLLEGDEDGDINWYTPIEGEGNKIDILPFRVSERWYPESREFIGEPCEVEVGSLDYRLLVPIHSNVGASNKKILCLREFNGGQCCVCDDMFDLIKKDKVKNKDLISALRPKWRAIYNVYDYNDEDYDGIKIWDMSFHLFEKKLRAKAKGGEDGYVPFASLVSGKIITFEGEPRSIGDVNFIEAVGVHFQDREEEYDEDVLGDVYALDKALMIPTAKEVVDIHYGSGEDEDREGAEEEKEEKEEKKSSGLRKRKRAKKEESNDEDNKCPSDLKYGVDTNMKDECQDCPEDTFEACCQEEDKIKAGGGAEEEKEAEPAKPKAKKKKSFSRKK